MDAENTSRPAAPCGGEGARISNRDKQITDAQLLADLKRVADALGQTALSQTDYTNAGRYSFTTVCRRFGSWKAALLRATRRPRYEDLKPPVSKFGVTAYTYRFGTFKKALAAFLQSATVVEDSEAPSKCSEEDRSRGFVHRTPRTINLRLRFEILRRDRFRCCACGRSPATVQGLELQVDHKRPWSQGGETMAENLHTLCGDCNRGKSDLPWNA